MPLFHPPIFYAIFPVNLLSKMARASCRQFLLSLPSFNSSSLVLSLPVPHAYLQLAKRSSPTAFLPQPIPLPHMPALHSFPGNLLAKLARELGPHGTPRFSPSCEQFQSFPNPFPLAVYLFPFLFVSFQYLETSSTQDPQWLQLVGVQKHSLPGNPQPPHIHKIQRGQKKSRN